MKRTWVLDGLNFKKRNPEKYQDPVLWKWFEMSFTRMRSHLSNNTAFFGLNPQESIVKAFAVDLLRLNTLRDIKPTQFSIQAAPALYGNFPGHYTAGLHERK